MITGCRIRAILVDSVGTGQCIRRTRVKVAVVIPTRNEARTIAAVTASADAGLAALGGGLIVNADGGSDDGTGPAFLATPTRMQKRLLTIEGPPGKGRNLRAAWKFCLDEGIDAVVTLDGDMTTVQPWWIEAFLRPIAEGRAAFVSPLYRRNLYRAVTSRNASRPFLYGWFGVDIPHPLSGNNAIARPLLERLAARAWTPAQLGYGIETAIVSTVLADRRAWATARLDICEDGMSVGRRRHILRDVTAATIEAAREFPPCPGREGPAVAAPMTFTHDAPPEPAWLEAFAAKARERTAPIWQDYARWAGGRVGEIEAAFAAGRVDARVWFCTFAHALLEARGAGRSRASEDYADALMPLLALRALTVWREIAAMSADAIDAASAAEVGSMRAALAAAAGWARANGAGGPIPMLRTGGGFATKT
jgi:hypothetical protein